MTLSRRPPESGVVPLRDVFDRWFRDPFLAIGTPWEGETTTPVDVREENDRYLVEAELPGVRPEDAEVTLDGRTLTIRATYGGQNENRKEGNYLLRERRRGSITRVITLPFEVDANQVSCTFENGELEVTLPKAAQNRARRIEVKAADPSNRSGAPRTVGSSTGPGTGSAGTGSPGTSRG